MDLERAMEFMLEQQARFQERQEKLQERQEKFQVQQEKFQENLVDYDKRLEKAERLLIRGAESLAIHREAMQETDRRITALVLAQQGNEHDTKELKASLKAFLDSMTKGGNGH